MFLLGGRVARFLSFVSYYSLGFERPWIYLADGKERVEILTSSSPLPRSDVHHFCSCFRWWEIVMMSHLDAVALGERLLSRDWRMQGKEESWRTLGLLCPRCLYIQESGWKTLNILGARYLICHYVSDMGVCFTTCYAFWHRLLSRWEREWVYPEKRNIGRLQSREIRPVSPPCQEKDALAQHQGCFRKPFLTCSRLLDWFLKTFIMHFCRVPVCLKLTLFVTEVTVRTAGIP